MSEFVPVFEHVAALPIGGDVITTVVRRGWYEFKEPNFWQWRGWDK